MAHKSVKFNIMIKQGNTWYAPKIEMANLRPLPQEEVLRQRLRIEGKNLNNTDPVYFCSHDPRKSIQELQQPNNSSSYPRTRSVSLLKKDKQRRCADDSPDAPGHSGIRGVCQDTQRPLCSKHGPLDCPPPGESLGTNTTPLTQVTKDKLSRFTQQKTHRGISRQ